MKTVIMSIGIPASGKSTLMRKVAQWSGFEYLGPDMLREEKYGDEENHGDDKALWVDLRARVAAMLKEGKSIILDSTFHTMRRRAHFIDFVRANGAEAIEGLYFAIPLETVVARSHRRQEGGGKTVTAGYIENVFAELQENLPKSEEGFDTLLAIDEYEKVTAVKLQQDSILKRYLEKITDSSV